MGAIMAMGIAVANAILLVTFRRDQPARRRLRARGGAGRRPRPAARHPDDGRRDDRRHGPDGARPGRRRPADGAARPGGDRRTGLATFATLTVLPRSTRFFKGRRAAASVPGSGRSGEPITMNLLRTISRIVLVPRSLAAQQSVEVAKVVSRSVERKLACRRVPAVSEGRPARAGHWLRRESRSRPRHRGQGRPAAGHALRRRNWRRRWPRRKPRSRPSSRSAPRPRPNWSPPRAPTSG